MASLGRSGVRASRAARIIKNLRAFARNESEPMGKVDIVGVINSAVELTEARLADGASARAEGRVKREVEKAAARALLASVSRR